MSSENRPIDLTFCPKLDVPTAQEIDGDQLPKSPMRIRGAVLSQLSSMSAICHVPCLPKRLS